MGENKIPESCCLKYVLRPYFSLLSFFQGDLPLFSALNEKRPWRLLFSWILLWYYQYFADFIRENYSKQAWHNSCSWPPATAKHPGNKFRLPERKKKSILQLIQGGGGDDHTQAGVNITRSPKEEIKEKVSRCHSTHQFGTNGQMTTIPASLCLKL